MSALQTKIAKRTYTKRERKDDPLPQKLISQSSITVPKGSDVVDKIDAKWLARSESKDWRPTIDDNNIKLSNEPSSDRQVLDKEIKGYLDSSLHHPRTKLSMLSEEEKKERHKEQMKKWREKNPDYNKTYRQKYYQDHKDEILAKRRAKRDIEKKIINEHISKTVL